MSEPAVIVDSLRHRYGERVALGGVSFSVGEGELFALVGPNGGGKSTTFRALSTTLVPDGGAIRIFGVDALREPARVRPMLGVVFQSPGLDKKLTVAENLRCQGALYGMRGGALAERMSDLLSRAGLADRVRERTETLSGGLRRRLEIARALLPGPRLLVLDEPTVGLDPLARREIWEYVGDLRRREGLTVLLTTHLLDEADRCDTVAFLDEGKVVVAGRPEELKRQLGPDVISLRSREAGRLRETIAKRFGVSGFLLEGELRLTGAERFPELVPALLGELKGDIESMTLGRPTLEDLFIHRTGRRPELGA